MDRSSRISEADAEALRAAALAVSSAEGDAVFGDLAQLLARLLGIEAAMIAVFADRERRRMRTLATCLDGRLLRPFEYELAQTPCAGVVGHEFRYAGSGAGGEFAPGTLFRRNGMDAYAAYSLNAPEGEQLGLIAVMNRAPLPPASLVEPMLKIFAVRAVAELSRVRAVDALAASEAQYRAIFNASTDALILWDSSLRRVDVNPAYERIYGWKREEVIGRAYDYQAVPPAYTAPRLELVRRSLAGESCRLEMQSVRKNGERFTAEVTTIPFSHRGEPHVLAIARDVTARRTEEELLRASEEQYRAIFNAAADAMVLRDATFRVVDVNAAYEAMSGRSREEVLGRNILTLSPQSLWDSVRQLHARALAGEKVQFESHARRKDGTRFHIEMRGVPIQHRGEPHVLYIGRDITERRRTEQALRASEEQYRAIFNAAADALVLRDANFRIVDVNPAYVAMSGYTREEVIGRDRVVANPPEMEERIRALHSRALAGEPVMLETARVAKDGTRREVELRGVPIEHRGEPHVLYIGRDIGERKRAEAALRDSEEQYRAIFNAAADALVLRDDTGRVVDVNTAMCLISGYSREEVLNERRWIFARPELSALAGEMHRRVIAGESVHFEIQATRKDGTPLDIEMRAVPMIYRGKPHALGMARDITARKRAEAERAALEAQLRQAQKMEAIGHLTGGIAHDFNNLLASIMGHVVLAIERNTGDEKLARYLEQSLGSARKARDLIRQMLTFSRGQRGTPRTLELGSAVEESLNLLRGTLPSSVEMVTYVGAGATGVRIDPVQLDQVILNLAINARDAMASAGCLTVSVRGAQPVQAVCASCRQRFEGSYVELAVADTGPGIAPGVLERMFEPFFTTKEVGRGSGMGLATVHGIVHEHRGHIVVDPVQPRGSLFRVLLPALAAGVSPPPAETAAPPGKTRGRLKGRVLVVDDEAPVAEFMRELLESWGLEASAMTSARAALDAFGADPRAYDLVITDQTMPGTTGFTLARELLERRPGLAVILCTGHLDDIAQRELESAGIRGLLHKPVEPDELYGLLRSELP